MMREFFSKRLGLALAACVGFGMAASTANAALITFDLKATSTGSTGATVSNGGKTVVFTATGGTNKVLIDLYATVQNTDGNPGNEGFQLLHAGFTSTEAAGSAQGNFTTLARAPGATSNSTSQNGSANNLDANPDLEWGGTDNQQTTGWNIDSAETFGAMYYDGSDGVHTAFGTDNGDGTVTFRIARLTWVPSQAGSADLIQTLLRNFTSGTDIQQRTVQFYSDSAANGTDTNGEPLYVVKALKPDDPNIALGAPVSITVTPEPASLGLLGLGAMGLLARRRRTA
jgi:hypothetical protein